jgi:outer membrane protein assembly factor BamB
MKTHFRGLILRTVVLPLAAVVFAPAALADNWPQWRGPHLNGSSDAKNLPDKLEKDSAKWQAKLPGPSGGTPVVWENKIFVSALDQQSQKLLALCVDRGDGHVLWRKEVGQGVFTNRRNNMASPSPITDGKSVWFYYGNGDLAAFDVDGNPLWSRNLQKDFGNFNYQWTYGSSPLLHEGRLYVQVLHRDVPVQGPATGEKAESYLLAVDPQTGKDLWRHVRANNANAESKESYGTPMPLDGSPRDEVVLVGGDCVTGHDAKTGAELWRYGGWNPERIGHWRMVPSVVTAEGVVIACAPKGGPVMAIKAGGEGDVSKSHELWKTRSFSSDVCIPLYYKGQLYVLDGDSKKLSCVELKTGKVKWSGSLGGGDVFRASPTGADGKIYCMNERGQVWVVSADEPFKILYKGDLGGADWPTRSSIVAVDGAVLVRTSDTLYCFGTK